MKRFEMWMAGARAKGFSLVLVPMLVALWVMPVFAVSVEGLTVYEQANMAGATHRVRFTHADLTQSSTNTAQTFTNTFSVAAKQGVELVAMMLVTDFDTISTNYTTSTLLEVGDGSDSDLYLTSTELNVDGTEVDLKFGRSTWQTETTTAFGTNITESTVDFMTNLTESTTDFATNVTATTTELVYLDGSSNVTTQTVVTAVSANTTAGWSGVTENTAEGLSGVTLNTTDGISALAQSIGRKVYTSADYVDFKFTPNAQEALSALSAGEVWIYLRVTDATAPR